MRKVFYYGGQKSGKSRLAEQKALTLAKEQKPVYIATYDSSYGDSEMQARIAKHQVQREACFVTLEEPRHIARHIKVGGIYLIDCMSMWILNTLEEDESAIMEELDTLDKIDAHIVFVLNDVGSGVIPIEPLSRKYVDRSGIIGQRLAQLCDEVYEVTLGLERRLK